jgi:hypothetical protein
LPAPTPYRSCLLPPVAAVIDRYPAQYTDIRLCQYCCDK